MMTTAFTTILGPPGSEGDFKYKKRKLIGTGSFGEAWLVERSSDKSIFVAKIVDLSRMSSRDCSYAYSEIKCLSNNDHPNIIKYIENFEECKQLLIIMEFADSGDLDREIKRRAVDLTYFHEHEAVFLFIQLCLSIDHIHTRKMLHRDIKSANVLLTSTGLIKLGDFGFSHQYDDTVSGVVGNTFCGTPYCLAPELWSNQRYSKKADIWSMGVVLYEIMALKRPFNSSNMKGLMDKILSVDYDPLPEKFSQEFRDVVRRILVSDASERPTVQDIFAFPCIRERLKPFMSSVKKNTRISDPVKEALVAHVKSILSCQVPEVGVEPKSAQESSINENITFTGYVRKIKGGDPSHTWKRRFLQIQKQSLILSESETDTEGRALGLEQIQTLCPVPSTICKRDFVFAVNTTGGKSMWFEAESQRNMEDWINTLKRWVSVKQ